MDNSEFRTTAHDRRIEKLLRETKTERVRYSNVNKATRYKAKLAKANVEA